MSKGLPELIFPLQFARSGRSLQGRIPVARMERLAESLYSTAGEMRVELRFRRGNKGCLCVEGLIQGELRLVCQRCLESLPWLAHCEVRLGLIPTATAQEYLEPGYEPLVAQEDSPLPLAPIIEDELILALPIAPMHPKDQCPGADKADASGTSHFDTKDTPFAALNRLKRRR
ncbi:MAG: DUF177 domain-containing protein [Gammaproteobacteria bacterium]